MNAHPPSKQTTYTARIQGHQIEVRPGETLLQAALREGLAFPNSCGVGGCGTCRCRVTEGEVHELTETAYLLTGEELAQRTVLACQTVPRSDVTVEVALHDTAAAQTRASQVHAPGPVAGVFHYAKFGMFHALGWYSVVVLLLGGWWTTLGTLAFISFIILGDHFGGDDVETPTYTHPQVLTGMLWGALPLMALIGFVSVWTVSAGDPLGFGAWVTSLSGYDVIAAREAAHVLHHVPGLVLSILMVGLVALIAGHELVHRTWDRTSLVIGRWLWAFAIDAPFSIEHVYGHHRYVSTTLDPATAARGTNVYAHVVRSTLKSWQSGWHIEAARLQRRGLAVWSPHNAWLRGHAMSLGLLAIAAWMGGAVGAAWFLACGFGGKSILEMVNYMEHYGMVRDPADPVQPYHSWNTNRRVSSWSSFNLTRHSHHHAEGETPFHELRPYPDAPMMVDGYLTTMFLTMVPPLWHRVMTPKVQEWDRVYASPKEKRLAARANRLAKRSMR